VTIPPEAKGKIKNFMQLLEKIPEHVAEIKLKTNIWSLKEILGHLVDSASNNHQRFIRLQEGNLVHYPVYHQEFWVQVQHYSSFDWDTLIQLWFNYNQLLLHVIKHMQDDTLQNTWQIEGKSLTLQWLVQDYFRHLFHHMQQFEERKAMVARL
jgi:hypothetical protein